MSDLLNKYKEHHDKFIDLLVHYHKMHMKFLERQSPRRTIEIRRVIKEMRLTLKDMEITSQLRKKERQSEYAEQFPAKITRKKPE